MSNDSESSRLSDPILGKASSIKSTKAQPSASALQEFWTEQPNLDTEVAMIISSANLLTDDQAQALHLVLSQFVQEGNEYGADFDFKHEISMQLGAIRAMRSRIMNLNGTIKEETSIREVKECLAAANTLTTALMKNHEKIINFDRQRAVEQATIEAVKLLPDEAKEVFFEEFDRRLKLLE